MFQVGPTFLSASRDHPAGDGLTRLQVRFAGASSADESSFALGSGVITEASAGNVTTESGYANVLSTGIAANYMALGELPMKMTLNLFGKIQQEIKRQDDAQAAPLDNLFPRGEQGHGQPGPLKVSGIHN